MGKRTFGMASMESGRFGRPLIDYPEGDGRPVRQILYLLEQVRRQREPLVPWRDPQVFEDVFAAKDRWRRERIALAIPQALSRGSALIHEWAKLPPPTGLLHLAPELFFRRGYLCN
jgi:hypothetical protein